MFFETKNTISEIGSAGLFWIAILVSGSAGATVVYDLNADWSDASNPNGVWAYREGLNALPHVADWTPLGSTVAQPAWSRLGTDPNFLPAWFKSTSDNPGGFDFLTGDVVVHSTDTFRGPMGVANVTWTSPVASTIDISGEVWMVRDIGRGNTWQLSLNGTPFTSGHVFSGDAFSRAVPFDFSAGSGGASVLNSIAVAAGDEIRLDLIADNPASGGDFVAVNLMITADHPTIYSFSADGEPTPSSDPTLGALLSGGEEGDSAGGTFTYDHHVAMTGTAGEASNATGSAIYSGALTNLVGSVMGFDFSDTSGLVVVGDDKYEPFGLTDVLVLRSEPESSTLVGFDVGGFTLLSVRAGWIENLDGAVDFLSNQDLLTVLPTFAGVIRFEFALIANPTVIANVDFAAYEVHKDDPDRDDISDDADNCPSVFNPNQFDADRDGIGNVCDSDSPPVDPSTGPPENPGRPENPGPPFSSPPGMGKRP